jgi:hypothetical protein
MSRDHEAIILGSPAGDPIPLEQEKFSLLLTIEIFSP